MTSIEIEKIIITELQSEPNIKNVFGLDLTKCLIKPIKQKYKNSNDLSEVYELWTVLEEVEEGYRIYFDQDIKTFGLGIRSDKEECEFIDIGNYGTFLETLYSM